MFQAGLVQIDDPRVSAARDEDALAVFQHQHDRPPVFVSVPPEHASDAAIAQRHVAADRKQRLHHQNARTTSASRSPVRACRNMHSMAA